MTVSPAQMAAIIRQAHGQRLHDAVQDAVILLDQLGGSDHRVSVTERATVVLAIAGWFIGQHERVDEKIERISENDQVIS
jgi:hypothetical protein